MLILVLNPGSSSLKYQLRRSGTPGTKTRILLDRVIDSPREGTLNPGFLENVFDVVDAAVPHAYRGTGIDAIGHRVVHGADHFSSPVRVTPEVIATIEELAELAPLHNAASVACMHATAARWPDTPQVAVFDTAFHHTVPEYASRYAIPEDLSTKYGIRRYGFHGISVEIACREAAAFLGVPMTSLNAVVAHLGNGASVTAVKNGRSIDTSMGMTPLEGLVMGTRSGDLDPSIVTLLQRRGLGPDQVDELLNHRAGLLGLSGSADMRTVQDAAQHGDPRALLATEMAAYRLAKYIAAYNMVVGTAGVLVFTGGIGEHSGHFRSQVMALLGPLGISIDEARNQTENSGIRAISTDESAFPVLVVPSDEERAIAEATAAVVLSKDPAIRNF
ncbi:acetate/propionate family kinase [Arthrobacter bambusae]|uniref:acetate/propionate family kinase n=1 Tax=Arthrobacter bambusae TaxID=1338426 RepID=UPI0027804CD9|nr:acetate/propionate family kinase [Arthrobacter bambusae]MDQ0028678.1 acetate kinase [Arthrobacter bambusae]MDQ0096528.1 acetate kinase [Arthrobacter bambusae]